MENKNRDKLRTASDQMKKKRSFDIRNLPVIYSHFLLVACVLMMSIGMLYVSNRLSLKTLTEKNLSDMQYRLEQNCAFISDTFAEAYSIPATIAQTRYYSYIKTENDGFLPDKYVAVLDYMGRTMQIPNYLSRDSDECIVYLRGTNSACSKNNRAFVDAEECFTSYMKYEETSSDSIIELLKGRSGLLILPMENVKIGTASPKRQISVIICDGSYPISVLCTYSEDALLGHLEIESLPIDTYIRMVAADGTILEEYPSAATDEIIESSYELQAELPFLKATVTVWIPYDYFTELQQPSVRTGWMIIFATAVIGFCLSWFLAKASVKPLQKLVSEHMPDDAAVYSSNEIRQLGDILTYSKSEANAMGQILLQNLLVRSLVGTVLSKEDVRWLKQQLAWENPFYRVALFNVDAKCNQTQIAAKLAEAMSDDVHCYPVSEWEIGMLLQDDSEQLQHLQNEVALLNSLLVEKDHYIYGGVSGAMDDFNNFHIAVRQARASITLRKPLSVFSETVIHAQPVTWLQHERLYQDILMNDQENARAILEEIASEVHGHNSCREIFYNVRFVMRSAAEELSIKYESDEIPNYSLDVPAWENVRKLDQMLNALFVHMEERKLQKQAGELDQILMWIETHYADPSLCIAAVSEQFQLSQKRIYSWVMEATGMRFNEYVLALRMKKSCALLCTTQLSVEQIAEQSGFSAESTFYRVFKKYFGVTPRQYRQSGGQLPARTMEEKMRDENPKMIDFSEIGESAQIQAPEFDDSK